MSCPECEAVPGELHEPDCPRREAARLAIASGRFTASPVGGRMADLRKFGEQNSTIRHMLAEWEAGAASLEQVLTFLCVHLAAENQRLLAIAVSSGGIVVAYPTSDVRRKHEHRESGSRVEKCPQVFHPVAAMICTCCGITLPPLKEGETLWSDKDTIAEDTPAIR